MNKHTYECNYSYSCFIQYRDIAYKELTAGFDLNDALGRYRASTGSVLSSLLHKPATIVGGEIVIDWYPARNDNTYGSQVLQHIYPDILAIYTRGYRSGTWSDWKRNILDSDLTKSLTVVNLNPIDSPDTSLLDTYSNAFNNWTWYRLVLGLSKAHPILGGGTFYIEGFKTDPNYEYQTAQIYTSGTSGIRIYRRAKSEGVWNTWKSI